MRVEGYGTLKLVLSGANPFQLQNALHSALKLRFFRGVGTFGALPQAPLRGFSPQTPISASRRFKEGLEESGDASLPDSCFFKSLRDFWGYGVTLGCRPNPPEGDSPSDSLLRFAAV